MKSHTFISTTLSIGALAAIVFAPGCATPKRPIASLPAVEKLNERTAPKNESITVQIRFDKTYSDKEKLADDVTSKRGFVVPEEASVVISVPVEEQQREQRNENSADAGLSFQTTGYFNIMEQQIEKALLSHGFNVLDRAKFEAILRDLRTNSNGYWGGTRSDFNSKEFEDRIAPYKTLLEQGQLTEDEYNKKYQELKGQLTEVVRRESYKKGDQELVDISELIRAAQSSKVQADYIFQVNDFKTEPSRDDYINIAQNPEFLKRAREHSGLAKALSTSGKSRIIKPGFYSALNGKLIDVTTGSIVWMGSHRVDSQNVDEFVVTLPIIKSVGNEVTINSEISAWNKKIAAKYNQLRQLRSQVSSSSASGATREAVDALFRQYEADIRDFESMKQRKPAALNTPWEYSYEFNTPMVSPVLPSANIMAEIEQRYRRATDDKSRSMISAGARQMRDMIEDHVADLSNLVSKELISQIPSAYD